jgi:hypothetical protein
MMNNITLKKELEDTILSGDLKEVEELFYDYLYAGSLDMVKYITENHKDKITSVMIKIVLENSVYIRNENIVKYILAKYKNIIEDKTINILLTISVIDNKMIMSKYIMSKYFAKITDKCVNRAIDFALECKYPNKSLIKLLFLYRILKQNNLCPERYKDIIILA